MISKDCEADIRIYVQVNTGYLLVLPSHLVLVTVFYILEN